MSVTPRDIKRAVWTRLARLVAGYEVTDATPTAMEVFSPAMQATSDAQPFRSLHHFAGEVSRSLAEGRENGLPITGLGQVPAMLLAWEGSRPLGAEGAFASDGPQLVQVVRRSHWRVFIAVADQRGDAWAMDTAMQATEAVESALAEFVIAGLFDGRGVRWVESVPWVTARRASYVTVSRFHADSLVPPDAADEEPPGEPFVLQGAVRHAGNDTNSQPVTVSTFEFHED